jgi:hypothetical protein
LASTDGSPPFAITTEVPSAVASLAASSLLSMPPVPPLDAPLARQRALSSTSVSRAIRWRWDRFWDWP